ncbi:MAG: membrane integrity-associated transporter subunit PqiC [Lentisphaeria bacterium]|nr:membrane integrity-associated transporter subunit PqiC [Lentisphaeria bacterium]
MKTFVSVFILLTILCSGCIQVNLPQSSSRPTAHFSLGLPTDFKAPQTSVYIREFVSECPAKFRMLSRKGSVLKYDDFAKWAETPSVMLSSAFRKLFGCDNDDIETAKYFLDGCIFAFEKNLETNAAVLRIQYTLTDRQNDKVLFKKMINTSIPFTGDTPEAFAAAMSKAVTEQAEKIRSDIAELKTKK